MPYCSMQQCARRAGARPCPERYVPVGSISSNSSWNQEGAHVVPCKRMDPVMGFSIADLAYKL